MIYFFHLLWLCAVAFTLPCCCPLTFDYLPSCCPLLPSPLPLFFYILTCMSPLSFLFYSAVFSSLCYFPVFSFTFSHFFDQIPPVLLTHIFSLLSASLRHFLTFFPLILFPYPPLFTHFLFLPQSLLIYNSGPRSQSTLAQAGAHWLSPWLHTCMHTVRVYVRAHTDLLGMVVDKQCQNRSIIAHPSFSRILIRPPGRSMTLASILASLPFFIQVLWPYTSQHRPSQVATSPHWSAALVWDDDYTGCLETQKNVVPHSDGRDVTMNHSFKKSQISWLSIFPQ